MMGRKTGIKGVTIKLQTREKREGADWRFAPAKPLQRKIRSLEKETRPEEGGLVEAPLGAYPRRTPKRERKRT